jgi:ligand-binding sensor domain-containing protein
MSQPADEDRDLPVLLDDDLDLPVALAPGGATEERVPPVHPGWSTYASQLEVRGLATGAGSEVWVATAGGVLRWRGPDQFARYGSEHGLAGNSMTGIAVDGAGRPWALADRGGLSRLEGGTWRSCPFPAGVAASCLAVDGAGRVWTGTAAGLLALDSTGTPIADFPFNGDYQPGEAPRAIAILDEDNVWAGAAQGLFHLANGCWERRMAQVGMLALAIDDEFLWFGTSAGLGRVELRNGTAHLVRRGVTTALAATGTGSAWAACGGDLGLVDSTGWRQVAGPSPGPVTALAGASADGVYAGTSRGLLRCGLIRSENWSTGAPPDEIGAGALGTLVQAITVGRRGGDTVVWAGTPAGLFEFVPAADRWTQHGWLRVEDVRAIAPAGDRIWIGSWPSGLRELRDGDIGHPVIAAPVVALTPDDGTAGCFAMTPDAVYRVDEDVATRVVTAEDLQQGSWLNTMAAHDDGTLFIGSAAGLFAFSDDSGVRVVHGDFTGTEVLALLTAGPLAGPMLVGTARGLYAGTPSQLAAVDALAGWAVTALAWDEAGTAAWAGTRDGLVRIIRRGDAWVQAAKLTAGTTGLASDQITALAVDDEHRLWVGTPSGLSSYLP